MPSVRGIGAGDIAWTDVETNKAKTEPDINLIIFFSCNVFPSDLTDGSTLQYADGQAERRR